MADAKLKPKIRREQIAEAALGLVAGEGLKRLSIAAVARRVGLVPSGIYRHFRSKDEVLDAVLDLLEKKLRAIVEAAWAEEPAIRSAGCAACWRGTSASSARAGPSRGSSSPTTLEAATPSARPRSAASWPAISGQVEQIVRQGQAAGFIRRTSRRRPPP